jgi:hypothetical protein
VLCWRWRVQHIDLSWGVTPSPRLLAALSEFGDVVLSPENILDTA